MSGVPSTYSMTRNGKPSAVVPPSLSAHAFAGLPNTPEALLGAFTGAQQHFLGQLSELSKRMGEYGAGLDTRMEIFQKVVTAQFVNETGQMRQRHEEELRAAMSRIEQVLGGLSGGIQELNRLLGDLNGKQVVVNKPKRGWFGRG